MRKAGCFNYVGINPAQLVSCIWLLRAKALRDSPPDLSHLQRMSQSIVEDMAFGRGDNLGNTGEAPQGRGVKDSISIALAVASLIFPAIGSE